MTPTPPPREDPPSADPEGRTLLAPPPKRLAAAIMAIGIGAVAVAMVVAALPRGASEPPRAASARAAPEASPTPTTEEEPEPSPADGIHAVLDVSTRTWAEISVDGSVTLQEVLEEGRRVELDARRQLELMLGNAGGVLLEVNGEVIPTGEPGEVVRLWFEWEEGRVVRAEG
jgi:cytoskeleton protein RodZ